MRIVFDLDGTLTDFNAFIRTYAVPFFQKKHNLKVVNENGLEIEDIFAISNKLTKKFWFSPYFLKFSLGDRLRKGATKVVLELLEVGHVVEIHSSRAMTCKKSIAGRFAKVCTLLQLWMNGIPINKVHVLFYENDKAKVQNLIKIKPDIIFDDKPEVISELVRNNFKCICIRGCHNTSITSNENVYILEKFEEFNSEILRNYLGKNKYKYLFREDFSNRQWDRLRKIYPFVMLYFKPIILNKANLVSVIDEGIIFAPNHQKTIDPLVITPIINRNIHYVVLRRFMEGKDSIFNNNKNTFLCKFTATLFKKLDLIPIERKCDNPKATNLNAMKDINGFLSVNGCVGIFPEGTTRKENGNFWGEFDDTFVRVAKKNNAWIQPITIMWREKRVVVNFGKAFKVGNMTIEEALQYYLEIQWHCLNESEIYIKLI